MGNCGKIPQKQKIEKFKSMKAGGRSLYHHDTHKERQDKENIINYQNDDQNDEHSSQLVEKIFVKMKFQEEGNLHLYSLEQEFISINKDDKKSKKDIIKPNQESKL